MLGEEVHMNKQYLNYFLSDVIKIYPQALDVLSGFGFESLVKNNNHVEIGPFIKLKTMLKTGSINENTFLSLLEEKINSSGCNRLLEYPLEVRDKMNMLALLPCPLKLPLQEAFLQYANNDIAKSCNYLIEGNANNQYSYYDYVEQFHDIDEIPDIIITPGINSFYYKKFADKFIKKGLFSYVAESVPNSSFSEAGILDPESNYNILYMNLLVMVVDKLKIGSTPIPKAWGDLLNPEFKNKIAIRGQNTSFCETTLLTIFKEYGFEGIRKLGSSVKHGWHPAQMVKAAGSGSKDSPAVSIMPYFYTKTIKYKQNVEIIWPEDGAIVSPVTMLVKAEKAKSLKSITSFFTSSYAGRICAASCFPALHPDVDNRIPQNTKFNWLGWDFIKQNDVGSLLSELNRVFTKELLKK
jgi:ABC-type Fe3+ transport system substrate-binding protein